MTIYGVNSKVCVFENFSLLSGVCVWYVSLVNLGKLKCECILTSLLKKVGESRSKMWENCCKLLIACVSVLVSYSLRV